jgi:hypothetical protein
MKALKNHDHYIVSIQVISHVKGKILKLLYGRVLMFLVSIQVISHVKGKM